MKSRKRLLWESLTIFSALPFVPALVRAAQFEYRYGHDFPEESSIHVRSVQLWHEAERETGGRLKVTVFPNNVLGSDSAMLSQVRTGAIQFSAMTDSVLSDVVPAVGIMKVGFAFKDDSDAIAAADGLLGDYIRREIEAKNITPITPKPCIIGKRAISNNARPIRTAVDLEGLKLRMPPSRINVDLFRTLGATPVSVSFAETYPALQTRLVDGTELPPAVIDAGRLYEVQHFLSLTNHGWGGWYLIANPDAWTALPTDVQSTVRRLAGKYVDAQRRDIIVQESALVDKLHREGMAVNTPADMAPFRAKLAPYYARWKVEFGPAAWALLERYSGGRLG